MSTDPQKLSSIDDRLARIEDLLVKIATKIDRIEKEVAAQNVKSTRDKTNR